jgi:hypothetical protein
LLKIFLFSCQLIDRTPPPGKQAEAIEPQDAVLINVQGWVADDNTVVENDEGVFQLAKSWLIVVGEGDVLPAIEMGVRFMETGQTALIWSHSKYAMGPGTRTFQNTTVPPHSNVMYKVTVSQKVMDTSRLNPYFTIQKSLTKKNIANDIYQHEWCPPPQTKTDPSSEQAMNRAIRLYTKIAKEMETLLQGTYFQNVEQDHPQRKESEQLLLDSLNNIVAVYLRQKDYHKAKLASVNVLEVDAHNLKALLRAAKAAMLDPASTLEEALAAIVAAESEITYKNPEEEKQLQRLKNLFKKKQQEYKEKSKSMFGNKLASSRSTRDGTKNSARDEPSVKQEEVANASATGGNRGSFGENLKERTSEKVDNVAAKTQGEGKTVVPDEGKKKEDSFWRNQAYGTIIQVVIPLLIYLLYRYAYPHDKFEMEGKKKTFEE